MPLNTTRSILKKLLLGRDQAARERLDAFFESLPDNPNILWYPSAGYDFRHLTELSGERAVKHNIEVMPDLYIHTDCACGLADLPTGEVENDGRTVVRLNAKYELALNPDEHVRYFVDPAYTDLAEFSHPEPRIQLLDITRQSHLYGTVSRTVLYFYFENNNFLDEVLLRYRLPVSHLVKIREGIAEGGVKMSISYVLDMLSALETKYLFYGDCSFVGVHDIETDLAFFDLKRRIIEKHNLQLFKCRLKRLGEVPNWDFKKVGLYEVERLNEPISEDEQWVHMHAFGKVDL